MSKTILVLMLIVLAILAISYVCSFDTDCLVGSKCVKSKESIYGICVGGLNPMFEKIVKFVQYIGPIFIAAYVASSVTWFFEHERVRNELKDKQWASCLIAQFSLGQYAQTLIRLKTQMLDEWKDKPDRHKHIKHISFDDSLLEIDINALAFILTTKQPDLLNRVQNRFSNCKAAIDSVRERNAMYMRVASSANLIESSTGEGKYEVSPLDDKFLSDFTDNMYKQVDATMDLLPAIQKELRDFIIATFKGKHALDVVYDGPVSQKGQGSGATPSNIL